MDHNRVILNVITEYQVMQMCNVTLEVKIWGTYKKGYVNVARWQCLNKTVTEVQIINLRT